MQSGQPGVSTVKKFKIVISDFQHEVRLLPSTENWTVASGYPQAKLPKRQTFPEQQELFFLKNWLALSDKSFHSSLFINYDGSVTDLNNLSYLEVNL